MDKTLNELKTVRTEQKDMLEKTASDKHVLMNYKLDNEQLRKEVETIDKKIEKIDKKIEKINIQQLKIRIAIIPFVNLILMKIPEI